MDIKNLPNKGSIFHAAYNKAGQPGLQKALGKLRRVNTSFRNLSNENIKTITGAIAPYEKNIRIKGGLSRLAAKKINLKLYKKYKQGDENFTKQDLQDAKKIIQHYGISQQEEKTPPPIRRPFVSSAPSASISANPISEDAHHESALRGTAPVAGASAQKQNVSFGIANLQKKKSAPISPSSGVRSKPTISLMR